MGIQLHELLYLLYTEEEDREWCLRAERGWKGKVTETLERLCQGRPGIGPGMAHPPRGEKCWEDVSVFSERRSEVIGKERGLGIVWR